MGTGNGRQGDVAVDGFVKIAPCITFRKVRKIPDGLEMVSESSPARLSLVVQYDVHFYGRGSHAVFVQEKRPLGPVFDVVDRKKTEPGMKYDYRTTTQIYVNRSQFTLA